MRRQACLSLSTLFLVKLTHVRDKGVPMEALRKRTPSPAMVVAILALIVAMAGTAYAAQHINGGAIKKQTIGGGKLKHKTLTGYQINTNKLGVVPAAQRAAHTYW